MAQLDPTTGLPFATSVGSLKQTLEGTKPGPQASGMPKAISLDDSEDSGVAFRSLMREIGQMAVQRQPSPMEKLRNFKEVTGLEAQTAGAIGGVLDAGEKERLMGITETFRTTMDLMREQGERKERQRQENLRWAEKMWNSVENPFEVFNGDDQENFRLGIMTPEMQEKAAKNAKKKRPETVADRKPSSNIPKEEKPLTPTTTQIQKIKNLELVTGESLSDFPTNAKLALITGFSDDEQKQFIREIKKAQKNQSVDVYLFLQDFAKRMDQKDSGSSQLSFDSL